MIAQFEVFDYPGRYLQTSEGEQLAKVRIQELQSKFKRLSGASDHRSLTPGVTFNLTEYPRLVKTRSTRC